MLSVRSLPAFICFTGGALRFRSFPHSCSLVIGHKPSKVRGSHE